MERKFLRTKFFFLKKGSNENSHGYLFLYIPNGLTVACIGGLLTRNNFQHQQISSSTSHIDSGNNTYIYMYIYILFHFQNVRLILFDIRKCTLWQWKSVFRTPPTVGFADAPHKSSDIDFTCILYKKDNNKMVIVKRKITNWIYFMESYSFAAVMVKIIGHGANRSIFHTCCPLISSGEYRSLSSKNILPLQLLFIIFIKSIHTTKTMACPHSCISAFLQPKPL